LDNRDAVQRADAVILALWLGPMKAVIDEVADLLPGKLVIDPSNPIAIAADGTVSRTLPDGQSAGEVVARWLPRGPVCQGVASGKLGESRSVATCTPSVD
jgi:predicted dinucleotide-binding enzyme